MGTDTDLSDTIATDMGRRISEQIQDLVNRNVQSIVHVVNVADITAMVARIAAGVGIGAGLLAMQHRRDGVEIDDAYEMIVEAVTKMIRDGKAQAVAMMVSDDAQVAA